MAVILIAGSIPGLPPLHTLHDIHLISNTSKLWATIAAVRPTIIILDDDTQSFNARKFCRDCKQNKTTSHIAVLLITEDPELPGSADLHLQRPLDSSSFHAAVQQLLQQL